MTPFCTNGHPVGNKARFCRQCGAGIAPTDASSTGAPPATGAPAGKPVAPALPPLADATAATARVDLEPTPEPTRSRRPLALLIPIAAAAVLLLGLGAAGALLLNGSDDGAAPTTRASNVVVSSTSTLPTTTTTLAPIIAPTTPTAPVAPVSSTYCVRDTTPLNLHSAPGIYEPVTGLLMIGNCEATDPAGGGDTRVSVEGVRFRRILWRGLDGWVAASKLGSTPSGVPTFAAGNDPACTGPALVNGWSAAESAAYTRGDPEFSAAGFNCTGEGAGAIAFARLRRGQLNPDGRTSEALFVHTGTGWRELAHSGPTLTAADLEGTGVSLAQLEALRSGFG